jgi:hypothetical protein
LRHEEYKAGKANPLKSPFIEGGASMDPSFSKRELYSSSVFTLAEHEG